MSQEFAKRGISDEEWRSLSSNERSDMLGTSFVGEKSLTDQSQAAEADINNIVRKFQLTGMLNVRTDSPLGTLADDVAAMESLDSVDLQLALNRVNEARFAFDRLPLHVRKRFGYDPLEFSTFVADPKNAQAVHDMGLTVVIPDDKIPRVEISNLDFLTNEVKNVISGKGTASGSSSSGSAV